VCILCACHPELVEGSFVYKRFDKLSLTPIESWMQKKVFSMLLGLG